MNTSSSLMSRWNWLALGSLLLLGGWSIRQGQELALRREANARQRTEVAGLASKFDGLTVDVRAAKARLDRLPETTAPAVLVTAEERARRLQARLAEIRARPDFNPVPRATLDFALERSVNLTVELLLDPAYAAAFRTQYLYMNEVNYSDWLVGMGVSRANVDRFITLIVDHQVEMLKTQIASGVSRPATATPENRAVHARLTGQVKADYDGRLRDLVGEAVFAQFDQLRQSSVLGADTDNVGKVAARLSYSNTPLTPAQLEQADGIWRGVVMNRQVGTSQARGNAFLEGLRPLLSAGQWEVTRQWQDEQQAYQNTMNAAARAVTLEKTAADAATRQKMLQDQKAAADAAK